MRRTLASAKRTYRGQPSRAATNEVAAAGVVISAVLIAIIIPSLLALRTVREAVPHVYAGNPTPYGYTISLLIYLIPIAATATWFFRNNPSGAFRRTAFLWTIGLLGPVGFALDLLFGNLFFDFPNPQATLQIFLPGYSFDTGGLVWELPIEEFIFYLAGFMAILLVYIWNNERWVPAYGVADYGDRSNHPPYILSVHRGSLVWGVVLIAAGIFYKKALAPDAPGRDFRDGFPLYFIFLVCAAVLPSIILWKSARPFVNWRAFGITLQWVLLTSLLWEATLAIPFGWWHYDHRMMLGLHVKAWSDLPIEAVLVWCAVTFTTTIVYETIKVGLHMHASVPDMLITGLAELFGPRRSVRGR